MNEVQNTNEPHPLEFLSFQIVVLSAAFKALLATSQNKDQVRQKFEQIIAQTQTHPSFVLGGQERSALLRRLVDDLFSENPLL